MWTIFGTARERRALRTGLGIVWTVLALATLPSCDTARTTVEAGDAWARLGAVPGRPAAAYFTVHGGPERKTLINVTTDVAIRSEMHESMANGMRPIASVPIPAHSDVVFAPGGRHVMLFDVNPGVKPGRYITLTLSFSDGRRIVTGAKVIAAGAPRPADS